MAFVSALLYLRCGLFVPPLIFRVNPSLPILYPHATIGICIHGLPMLQPI
jgi:hypothetical protein